jgi:hypothetical protein
MATSLPTIGIIANGLQGDGNKVWEQMGRGPETFMVPLVPISPPPTHLTPPTHYMFQDMSANSDDVLCWQQLCEGHLPEGVEWTIITEPEVLAACGAGNLQVYSAAGLVTPADATAWRTGVFSGRGLQFVPLDPDF